MIRIRPRHVLIFLLVFVWTPASAPRAQSEDVLTRANDDRAATVEQRQQALAKLLAAANGLRNTEPSRAATFLNRAGELQIRLNLSQEALTTFRDALTLLKQTPESPVYIDTLNGMAAAYGDLSKCDEAQDFVNQAIPLSERSGYVAGKAKALLTLGDCQGYSDPALALQTAQAALELWRSISNKSGIARSYFLMSDFQIAQHKLDEATQSNEAALQIWSELNIPAEQAEALINLGFIAYRKGAMQDSLLLLEQAQPMLDEKAEPFKMGQITTGMGQAFVESGLPETGLIKLKQAIEYYRLAGNPRAVVDVSWDIGKAQYLLGDYSEALRNLQQTISDAESIKEATTIAMCHDFLGRTYAAMDDQTTALSHLEMAMDLYTQGSKRREAARTLALIGQLKQREGKANEARTDYQRALATFRTLSDHVNESATLYALGRLELKENHLDVAKDYLSQSINVTENMRRVSTSSDLTTAFSAAVHDRYESYIECLMRKHLAQPGRGLDVSAFETSELARARSLAELLHATQTNLAPGVDPQLAGQERSLRQSLLVKENDKVALLGKTYQREELEALDAEITRLADQYKQVNETIKARYPAYDQMNRPTAWDLPRIQEQIVADDQTVLLEYSLGAERSYVWAVTRDHIASYELPSQATINEAAQKVYGLLAAAGDAQSEPELTKAAQELGQMILLPVVAELNKQRVIVVADGALNYIPFQILPASSATNEPLVGTTEIINAPSASILGQLKDEIARRPPPTRVLAAFGDPVFPSNYSQRQEAKTNEYLASAQSENERWQPALRDIEPAGDSFNPATIRPLFYSKLELANLRDVAGPESFVATGFDASRENLTSADLTKYAILHFATHGVLDPKRPEHSGLFLSMVNRNGQAQNGFVGLQDIYNLHAPVELVVLSACRTGLGKDVRGEGLIGLTRGFMYAGAASVVASLWKVDDEATAALMKQFYTNMLQRGMPPAAALRAAQNSIRQQPQWRSPHFWAAFTLQGEYRQVIKAAPAGFLSRRVQIVLGLSLLLLLAAAAWWYRAHQNPAR